MKDAKRRNTPIKDAIIEVRFQSNIPDDAVTGVIFGKLASKFPNGVEPLPASQLPKPIRDSNPDLKYQATHKFSSDKYYLAVAPGMIGLGVNITDEFGYPGWKEFYKFFSQISEEIKDISETIVRVGVRYINFFQEDDFLDKLTVKITTGWEGKGQTKDENLVFLVQRNNLRSRVIISTAATGQNNGKTYNGQLIDIDTFIDDSIPAEDLNLRVEEAHSLTEEVFFSLLSDDFREELKARA